MAAVEPVGLRFVRSEWAAEVPSPPHDALAAEDRRRHVAEHPRSYLTVTRHPEDLEAEGSSDPENDAVAASRSALEELLADGVFGPEADPALYLYRLETDDHRQTGLVCGVATADYDAGLVRIHERVNHRRAEQLAHHLHRVGVQSSPIALAFRSAPGIEELMERVALTTEPLLEVADAELRQSVWAIDRAEDIERVVSGLADLRLYLIDGHHRAAAASSDRAEHHTEPGGGTHLMLGALFPYRHLRNQAFHRVVTGIDPDELAARLATRLPVVETTDLDRVVDRHPNELAVALPAAPTPSSTSDGGAADRTTRWLVLAPPDDGPGADGGHDIDPARLARHVLEPVLGIDESGADPRLSYRPGPSDRAAMEGLRVAPGQAVFWMRPVPLDTLLEVADQGGIMPPKSTYFEPKVRSGLFVRLIDPDLRTRFS